MRQFLAPMWRELGGGAEVAERVEFVDSGDLPSVFAVCDFAAAAVGAAGAAIAELIGARFGEPPRVSVSRRLSSLWYGWSIRPDGWTMPAAWDPIAGDYPAADGWIRLHTSARAHFRQLLRRAHVLVHGYRADALGNLGLDASARRAIRPGLIDVSLNAYGWSGPWCNRRGFDSLVQMSVGIADAGMRLLGKDRPTPLPVQALDHATGYLMAAAVVRGLTQRLSTGRGVEARASLARTAELLISGPAGRQSASLASGTDGDWSEEVEPTAFGPAHRLRAPVNVGMASMQWDRPAVQLGSSPADW